MEYISTPHQKPTFVNRLGNVVDNYGSRYENLVISIYFDMEEKHEKIIIFSEKSVAQCVHIFHFILTDKSLFFKNCHEVETRLSDTHTIFITILLSVDVKEARNSYSQSTLGARASERQRMKNW